MSLKWFVIHAYSGYENHAREALLQRIERFGVKDKFGEILIPTEEVVEMREGQSIKVKENSFLVIFWFKWK